MSDSLRAATEISVFEIFDNIRRTLPSQQRTNPHKRKFGTITIALAFILALSGIATFRLDGALQTPYQLVNFLINAALFIFLLFIFLSLLFSIYFWLPDSWWPSLVDRFNSHKWLLRTFGYAVTLTLFVAALFFSFYLPFQTSQEDFSWPIWVLSVTSLAVGLLYRSQLRNGKEGIFSGSLHRRRILVSEGARIIGDAGSLLAFITILVALIFGLPGGQENNSWQTVASMISGAVLGLLLGRFQEGVGVRKKLQETVSQGCGHLRDIELTALAYQKNSADFTSRDTLEVTRPIERYLEWVGTFRHGKNQALVITVDWQSTELWLLLRDGLSGKPYEGQLKESYEKEISELWALHDQPGELATLSGNFARDLRERLEKSQLLDS